MANQIWRGSAKAVAELDTLTPGGTIVAADTFSVTINNKVVSFVTTDSTIATACIGVQAALAACTEPEFLELTYVNTGTTVTATANTPGKPFTMTTSIISSAGTFTHAVTTASSGPNDWGTAANWSTNSVPVNSDTVYFSASRVSCLYGLNQSAVTLTALNIEQSFTGQLGNPDYNGNYFEYRGRFLQIGATTCTIGYGPGTGSQLIRLDFGSVQTALTVLNTGSSSETGVETVVAKGTHASNAWNVYRGSVGFAVKPGDTATVATYNQGYIQSSTSDANVRFGSGVTWTTINQSGGTFEISSNGTTVTKTNGILNINGTATLTNLNLDGGPVYYRSTGTLGTAKVGDGGMLDFSQDMRARTVTNCTINKGATLNDPFRTVTFTNPVVLNRASISEVKIDLGTHIDLAVSAGP